MLNQARLKCFFTEQNTHTHTYNTLQGFCGWTGGPRVKERGRLMLRAHYPQCSAGPLPARPRRSLRCCSPAPLIPLSGWTLWPSSSWIPKTPSKTKKTCFCETFLRRAVCILLHKETQGRAAERFQAWVDATCVRCMCAVANYTLRF